MSFTCPVGFRGRFLTDLPARAAYSEGAGPFRIVPAVVAVPTDRDDLQVLVRHAADVGVPLTPRGAGSGIPGGNLGAGIVVDLGEFHRPARVALQQTANVGAAVTPRTVNQIASHFGFRLPPDPSSGAFCTIGGMVATNAAGARSYKAGSIRRWVRGVELVTADGDAGWLARRRAARAHRHPTPPPHRQLAERLAAEDRFVAVAAEIDAARPEVAARFPRTRKNSSGYALDAYLESGDLVDLVIGSEGTLGIVTRVELDVERVPGATGTLLITLATLDGLSDVVAALGRHDPAAIELLDRSFLDLAGPHAAPIPLEDATAVLLVDFERAREPDVRHALRDAERDVASMALRTDRGVSPAERDALWRIRHGASPALAALPAEQRSLQIVEDGCVPVPMLGRYLAGVREAAAAVGIRVVAFGHAGDGHLHVNALVDTTVPDFERRVEQLLDTVTALVIELGGSPSGEHGDGRLRTHLLERLYGPRITQLFARVKQAFDPARILNPGVIVADGTRPPLGHLKVGPRAAPIPADVATALRERERTAGWATPPLASVGHVP
jgi:FAD/FMN-containing dehydrogenase